MLLSACTCRPLFCYFFKLIIAYLAPAVVGLYCTVSYCICRVQLIMTTTKRRSTRGWGRWGNWAVRRQLSLLKLSAFPTLLYVSYSIHLLHCQANGCELILSYQEINCFCASNFVLLLCVLCWPVACYVTCRRFVYLVLPDSVALKFTVCVCPDRCWQQGQSRFGFKAAQAGAVNWHCIVECSARVRCVCSARCCPHWTHYWTSESNNFLVVVCIACYISTLFNISVEIHSSCADVDVHCACFFIDVLHLLLMYLLLGFENER